MMWLPGQALDALARERRALIEVAPDHASLYLLELYPNAPLRDEMARSGWAGGARRHGGRHVSRAASIDSRPPGTASTEISNVARDGRLAWHNVKYWTDGEWLGLGCGAHGTRHRVRWRNVSARPTMSLVCGRGLACVPRPARSRTRTQGRGAHHGAAPLWRRGRRAWRERYGGELLARYGRASSASSTRAW